jgi:hypothetical protein
MKNLKYIFFSALLASNLFFTSNALAAPVDDLVDVGSLATTGAGGLVLVDGSSLESPIGVEFIVGGELLWAPSQAGFTFTSNDFSVEASQEFAGSAKFVININKSSAPINYEFKFRQENTYLEPRLNEFGAIDLYNSNGDPIAFLLPPWALDATGAKVPTHFEVDGNSVLQKVEFRDGGFIFPITADPYLGSDLIASVSATLVSSNYNLKVAVTPYLGSLYFQYPTAYAVFGLPYALAAHTYAVYLVQTYGWPEVLSKLSVKYSAQFRGYVYSKPTFQNQFDCHALGAPIVFLSTVTGFDNSPTWDLEGFRVPTTNYNVWVATQCNW